jgi:hypothetical protein
MRSRDSGSSMRMDKKTTLSVKRPHFGNDPSKRTTPMSNKANLNIKNFDVLTEQKEDDEDFLVSTTRNNLESRH